MIGRILSHYTILEKLGEGGMGVVYKARDTRLNRHVVLKVLRSEPTTDADRRRRFIQEARAASALNSPNIVTIYDIVSEGELDTIVMEYVQGHPLDFLIPSGGMPPAQAVRFSMQIAEALQVAHSAGIIHRDLKPANVMITPSGVVKLVDFGLAKLTSGWSGGEIDAPVTVQGSIVGTVCYMSPEQALARPVDERADLFSLGALLYEMLTGRRAFGHASSLLALTAVIRDSPEQPSHVNVEVPPALSELVMRCLEKDPGRRPRTALEVRRALQAIPLREAPPETTAVRDACNVGSRAVRQLSSAALAKARACFEQAIRTEGDHSVVYAGMSEYYAQISLLGMAEPLEVLPKAIWAANKALAFDPASEPARVTLLLLRANHEYRWADVGRGLGSVHDAHSRYRRALWYLRPTGRFDEAEADVGEDAAARGWIALERGDLTEAARWSQCADLDSWLGCWVRAWTLIAIGKPREALEVSQAALQFEPGNSWLEAAVATAYAQQRQAAATRKLIEQPHWKPASFVIPALVALGETDRAFAAAQDAVRRRDPGLITVLRLPLVAMLSSDTRYLRALSAVGVHTASTASG